MSVSELPHGVVFPPEPGFEAWLEAEGLTEDVVSVVTNLRRYFPTREIRVRKPTVPENLDEVEVVIDLGGADEASVRSTVETLAQFDREWYVKQRTDLVFRVGVYWA
ncbi:MAG: hypothetical protein KF813_02835 [Trueperaceae bacterium]|nr:hypothetical protein [Trueperaceae bacterium]